MEGGATILTPEFGETSVDDLPVPMPRYDAVVNPESELPWTWTIKRSASHSFVNLSPSESSQPQSMLPCRHPQFIHPLTLFPALSRRSMLRAPKKKIERPTCAVDLSCHVTPRAMIIVPLVTLFMATPSLTPSSFAPAPARFLIHSTC